MQQKQDKTKLVASLKITHHSAYIYTASLLLARLKSAYSLNEKVQKI